jgi:class 3 adenylate cyclase
MMPGALYLKDPATSRFVAGGLPEIEALFGSPLPLLPRPEPDASGETWIVRFHPRLRTLLGRFLQGLLGQIGGEPPARNDAVQKDQKEYEAALRRLLASVRGTDRRQGLTNLFWLAHTLDAALTLREMERKTPAVRKLKYSLHPLLSSFYRRVDLAGRRDAETADPEREGLFGSEENPSLVEALIEDGFAFTEPSIADLDFNQFLAANKRYRLGPDAFFEIYLLLLRETERRVREGDRGVLARAARHLPELSKEQYATASGTARLMLSTPILTYLLADAWSTGAKLMASPKLRAEAERRKPSEVMDVFLDLVTGTKRFEVVAHLRDRVRLIDAFNTDRALEEKIGSGYRVFEFGDSAQILNNALNATVMFLDLRGFTKTSEGQISEGDLTRELYKVFDPFTLAVQRCGGTVDKFLGDGIMVTFGTQRSDPLSALNALRAAILCQETLARLRRLGRTQFRMGIAIHYGRMYLARFLADDRTVHATVIGRNVNLAGRLSSASSKPIGDEEEPSDASPPPLPASESGLQVSVEEDGTLFNEGIALSQDTLAQLEAHLPLTHTEGGWVYFDETIGRRILIRYAGDAKFKGVRSSFPVYQVDYEV